MKSLLSIVAATAVVVALADRTAFGESVTLREEISLNGIWNFSPQGGLMATIPVPEYWDAAPGFDTDQAVYRRQVTVPMEWSGKVIKVEFEGVNHIADVHFNDQLVASHVGGWVPFTVDITSYLAVPNQTFTLRVDVKGGNHWPIVAAYDPNIPHWPVGWFGHIAGESGWGIMGDVWLRAYGVVHIEDAYIITSYRDKTLTAEYTLKNTDSQSRTVQIVADAINCDTEQVEKTLTSSLVTLDPGQTKTITLSDGWADPQLWFPYPDDRRNLYYLQTRVLENGTEIDRETRRFGFREIWISGDHYMLNGIRLNLFGESLNEHQQHFDSARYDLMDPNEWPNAADKYLEANIRWIRFHMGPIYPFILDVCDEKGLMVMDESAIYARGYMDMSDGDKDIYMANSKIWIKEWIKSRRNHPCLMIWSASNEMSYDMTGNWPADLIRQWGDEIRIYDWTRPVSYDGDEDPDELTYNEHYPEDYGDNWDDFTIYNDSSKGYPPPQTGIPCGIGEFLTHYNDGGYECGEENKWLHGIVVRGLRYLGWDDIRPYRLGWIREEWDEEPRPARWHVLRNGYAFVGLFDKAYDELKTEPVMTYREGIPVEPNYPEVNEGQWQQRTLALFNDEFQDTRVEVEVRVQSQDGNTTYASGTRFFCNVPLGEHIDIPYSFQVPCIGGANLAVILITKKNGIEKFNETRWFKVNSQPSCPGPISNDVIIGETMGSGLTGDFNGDCKVDFDDLVIIVSSWLESHEPFFESEGLVVMEAEHYFAKADGSGPAEGSIWTDGIGGGSAAAGYIQALPDNGLCIDDNIEAYLPHLIYKVDFNTTGDYYLWLKAMAQDSNSDSVHFGLDGSAISSDSNDCLQLPVTNAFEWLSLSGDGTTRPTIPISLPGSHDIDIWMREDGAKLDRLLLTTDSDYIPGSPFESVGFSEQLAAGDLNNDGKVNMMDFAIFAGYWLSQLP